MRILVYMYCIYLYIVHVYLYIVYLYIVYLYTIILYNYILSTYVTHAHNRRHLVQCDSLHRTAATILPFHTYTFTLLPPPPTQPAKRRRSNHPSSSILSPPPVTPLLTPSQAHVSNIHAPIIVPNEKTGLTQNDSKAEDTKFVFVDKGNSTVIPPASSGTTSSRLPDEGPRPQGSLLLQPRGGATTSREIPLSQLPTSGLHFGALSTSSQASRLGGLTFTAPPLRQASPPVSSPQPLLLSGARGSEAEPPSVSEFSPMFHASSSQVCICALGAASLTS